MVAATSNFEGMSAETLVAFGALFGLSHVLSGAGSFIRISGHIFINNNNDDNDDNNNDNNNNR